MIVSLVVAVALQVSAFPPPAGAVCAEARFGKRSRITFVSSPARLAELQANAITGSVRGASVSGAACRFAWSSEQTQALCAAIGDPKADLDQSLLDTIGVSGEQLCSAAREVAPDASANTP